MYKAGKLLMLALKPSSIPTSQQVVPLDNVRK